MPSPLGHGLGGIVAGWFVAPRHTRQAAIVLAAVAIAPDLDLVAGTHREASHSAGAAVLAGLVALGVTRVALSMTWRDAVRWSGAVALAWFSHVVFDWLSNDTRPPIGVMALWPFTQAHYKASIEIFPPISRRYWESQFWLYNLRAVVMELVILGPVAAVVVWRATRAR
jgi:hypothetical protein